MRPIAMLLPISLLLVASPPHARIVFHDPVDWRCVPDDACLVCRNVTAHASVVDLRQGGDPARSLSLPQGAALRICPPGDEAI